MSMNVTDLRRTLRRLSIQQPPENNLNERRKAERRVLPAESTRIKTNSQRIWLTPGERTLIEDLYFLDKE